MCVPGALVGGCSRRKRPYPCSRRVWQAQRTLARALAAGCNTTAFPGNRVLVLHVFLHLCSHRLVVGMCQAASVTAQLLVRRHRRAKRHMDTMRLLFDGKRSAADVVDYDLVAFLRYYVSNAQICFNNICNASGCLNVASKTCSRCRVARYCSRECQITDWRAQAFVRRPCRLELSVLLVSWKPQ